MPSTEQIRVNLVRLAQALPSKRAEKLVILICYEWHLVLKEFLRHWIFFVSSPVVLEGFRALRARPSRQTDEIDFSLVCCGT